MENTNIRLLVPKSARELETYEYLGILCDASTNSKLEILTEEFRIKIPGFNKGYYNEGIYTDVYDHSWFGSLVCRVYDYPNIKLGSFRLKEGNTLEVYSPRISGWNVFSSDRSSLAKINDSKLRNFLASFYEALKSYPECSMQNTLRNGHSKEHSHYKKMENVLQDFEEFFNLPYDEYHLPGRKSI